MDERVVALLTAAQAMELGQWDAVPEDRGNDEVAQLARSLRRLGETLEHRLRELATLAQVTATINSGVLVEEVLNHVYDSFRPLIPYDRIGFALIEGDLVRAHWARTDMADGQIVKGYCLRLEETSLGDVMASGTPRIINDLEHYALSRPESKSTRRMLAEGIRSSLTCPLQAMGKPLGFLFFSSRQVATYESAHRALFQQLAGQLAMAVEKGRLYEELATAIQMRDRWVGMAAHDLRNPLASIKGFLTLFQQGALGPLDDKQKKVMGRMLRASDTMLQLINDLLEVSAIDAGSLELDLQTVALDAFLNQCLEAVELQADSKGIAVDVMADASALRCDPRRLGQAVTNLLTNALKFSPRGSRVELTGHSDKLGVRIDVKDQGVGLSPADLSGLFQPFSRASSRATEGEISTGLGLAIVKRIVEAHGGRVWVESTPDEGSTFSLAIPAGSAEPFPRGHGAPGVVQVSSAATGSGRVAGPEGENSREYF